MPPFWTAPTNSFWLTPNTQPFWVTSPNWQTVSIGSGTSGSFATTGGNYSVSGTGLGVNGVSDSLFFAYQLAGGNLELITQVTAQSGTSAYAIAGLMISDLFSTNPPGAQCALITVSPQNGVNFTCRLTDSTTGTPVSANTTLGPSLATPIWLRLVVSQTSVAGFESSDGISWNLVGQCTMTLPSSYYAGFAVANYNVTPANQATYPQSDFNYMLAVPQRSANLLTWLRADAGIIYSGTAVTQWNDQSSSGYNATLPLIGTSPGPSPVLLPWGGSGPAGLPAISFPNGGTTDYALTLPPYPAFASGLSLFVVMEPQALTANSTIIDLGNGTAGVKNDNVGLAINSSGAAQFYAYNGSTGSSISAATALSTSQYQLIEAIYDGISVGNLLVNGILKAGGSVQTSPPASTSLTNNFIAQVGGGGNYLNGSIAEILIYGTVVSETTRQLVENYLLAKYSI